MTTCDSVRRGRRIPSLARACAFARTFSTESSGSQIIEFSFVLIPLMLVIFIIMDLAWICFAKQTLQHAVQVGVRAAIPDTLQTDGIKAVVQSNAMGFLNGDANLNLISVTCYQTTDLSAPVPCGGGDVIEVAVTNVPVNLLGPVLGTNWTSINLSANSSDLMEGAPVSQ
jgi:hypothetical protein